MKRWGFIGAGKMATALVHGMLRARLAKDDSVVASDPLENARTSIQVETGIAVFESNIDVLKNSDVLVLAVKPQSMSQVLAELSKAVTSEHLVISIAAGITIESIVHGLGTHSRVVRVMPNTPALIGEGVSAYALGEGARPEDAALVEDLLGSVGQSVKVAESMLDAVTGLSGSGPAFVYLVIEALSDGGVRAGLPRDTANLLAVQTVVGAARMVQESGEHPGVLKDQVASPGGTTIAGLHALEKAGVRGAFIDAVVAATRRSAELAALADPPPTSKTRGAGR
jgi:pyrroline-5-carboxylate reductase